MTSVLITIDTELSVPSHRRGATPLENFGSSILGQCGRRQFGIFWLMDVMEDHGVRGTFFVDPLPALVFGPAIIADIVGPILERGHEVQLHIHTEWLEWVERSPVGGRQGENIADFGAEDQQILLRLARELLMSAGAPSPSAFRAGNYGADDRTLAALASLGFLWDASFNPAYLGDPCRIDLPAETLVPVRHCGIAELPVAAIRDRGKRIRPAQVCAMSNWEMGAALAHAAERALPAFSVVTHSFEMLSRDRKRPNGFACNRFKWLCRTIAARPGLRSATFADLSPEIAAEPESFAALRPNFARTAERMAEQLAGRILFERPPARRVRTARR